MENLDLGESSGYQDMSFDGNSNNSNSYSKEDCMVCYGNISNNSEDTWKSGLELYDDEQTIFSSSSNRDIHSQYQVYAIIDERQKNLMATTTQSSTQQTSEEEQITWQRGTLQNLLQIERRSS
jgi:hypothetical protein